MSGLLLVLLVALGCLSLYKVLQPDPPPPAPPPEPPLPPPPPPLPPPREPTEAEIAARDIQKKIEVVHAIASFKDTQLPAIKVGDQDLQKHFDKYLEGQVAREFHHPDKVH